MCFDLCVVVFVSFEDVGALGQGQGGPGGGPGGPGGGPGVLRMSFCFLIVLGGFWGVGASKEGRGGPGSGPGEPGGGPAALEVVDLEVARSRTSMQIVYYF